MSKFKSVENVKGMYHFFCPGCGCYHGVWTNREERPCWDFNGDVNKPTVSPSILVTTPYPDETRVCHSFVKDGKIQFLDDCTHVLRGQTVELPDIDNL